MLKDKKKSKKSIKRGEGLGWGGVEAGWKRTMGEKRDRHSTFNNKEFNKKEEHEEATI